MEFTMPVWVSIEDQATLFHASVKAIDNFYIAQCVECEDASSVNEDLHQCLVKLVESIKLSVSLQVKS